MNLVHASTLTVPPLLSFPNTKLLSPSQTLAPTASFHPKTRVKTSKREVKISKSTKLAGEKSDERKGRGKSEWEKRAYLDVAELLLQSLHLLLLLQNQPQSFRQLHREPLRVRLGQVAVLRQPFRSRDERLVRVDMPINAGVLAHLMTSPLLCISSLTVTQHACTW